MSRIGEEYFPLGLVCAAAVTCLKTPPTLVWTLSLSSAAVFLALFRRRCFGGVTRSCLAVAMALAMAAAYATARKNYLDTRALPLPQHEYIDFYARLAAYPRIEPQQTVLLLEVGRISFRRRVLEKKLRLLLRVPGDLREFYRGDRVRVAARVIAADPRYMYRGVHFLGRAKSALQVQLIARGPPAWSWPGKWRNRVRRLLEARFATAAGGLSESGALLEAMILGDRGRASADFRESMLAAGVYHLLAISGAHVGILALVVLGGMGLLGIRRPLKIAAAATALPGYLVLADFPVSAVRAGVMAGVLLLGRALDHPADAMRSLSLTGLLLFSVSPLGSFGPGFILTFTLAAAILLGRDLARHLPAFLPRAVREGIGAGLNAGVVSLPLSLLFFQRFALAGPAAGLVLLPLCGPILALALPMSLGCLLAPVIAGWLLEPLDLLLKVFLWGVRLAAGLQSSMYRPPPAPGVVGITLLLFVTVYRAPRRRLRRGAAALLCLVLSAQAWPPPPYRPQRMQVFFLDVGQGDCACVVFPGGDALLIDGGGSRVRDFSVGRRVVLPFLLRGRVRVRWMAISHFHPDHAAGIVDLVPLLRPREVWISSAPRGDPLMARLIDAARGVSRIRRVVAGPVLETAGCRVTCLSPERFSSGREVENDDSQVLLVEDDCNRFLFSGDAGSAVEERILSRAVFPPGVAVLKAGHHGSATSSCMRFLSMLVPRLAVFSCSARNPFGFPHAWVIERLRHAGIPWVCTSWAGHLRIHSGRRGIEVSRVVSESASTLIFARVSHTIQ